MIKLNYNPDQTPILNHRKTLQHQFAENYDQLIENVERPN